MRISDWSSDVCSSDLKEAKPNGLLPERGPRCIAPAAMMQSRSRKQAWKGKPIVLVGLMGVGKSTGGNRLATRLDRRGGGWGKSVSGSVERGGRRFMYKQSNRLLALGMTEN